MAVITPMDACDCGRVIDQPATGRRRRKCLICSPPDKRDRSVKPLPSAPTVTTIGPAPDAGPGPIEAATLAELDAAERTSSSAGVEALHLAHLLDAGGYTAAGAAVLAKARREALAVALANARPADDAVTELQRRREAKARAAGA